MSGVETFAGHVAAAIAWGLLALALALNGLSLWQLVLARRALGAISPVSEASLLWRRDAEALPPITLLVPAYNEALTIVESVRSLLALQYPRFEIVVVNDGSADATLDVLIAAFELEPIDRERHLTAPHQPIRALFSAPNQPRLVVVDKENGGKADALNAALNLARSPIVCSMDADSLLERDSLLKAVRPFVEDPRRTVAVGGSVRVANGCRIEFGQVTRVATPRNPLALLQVIEYLRAFLMARMAWSRISAPTIISGAFGLFSRQLVLDVGGYSLGTVGEDMDLVLKLHKHCRRSGRAYRIAFVPEAVCWTEVPENLAVLGRQRARWQRGALECFLAHRDMVLNPRYGRVGYLGLGHVFLVDLVGPTVEMAALLLIPGLWLLGLLPTGAVAAQFAVTVGLGAVVSVGALALEESKLQRFPNARSLLILLGAALVENLGYRQLNSWWRLKGSWQFVTGAKTWGHMPRKGFAAIQQAKSGPA